jgi:hemerythrin-like domain-containing protein
MTTAHEAPRPDVTEMIAVHQALRESLGGAAQLIRAVEPTDGARVALVANVFDNVLDFLHVHHEGEEQLVFPLLRERCPDQIDMLDRMASQHADVVSLVQRSDGTLSAWAGGNAGAQEDCALAFGALAGQLDRHLEDEERCVLPLCSDHLSLAEWGALPGHAMGNFTGDKVWLILGLIRDHMSQVQREQMLANMPPPAVDMWTSMGEQAYKNLVAEVGPPLA